MVRGVLTVFLILISAGICLGDSLVLPADPPASRTVPLQEIWRIGGEEDEDILLGVITDGALDDSGRIYLLDNQLAQVLVISPEGELVTTVGREGEGPGELRNPSSLFLTPEGRIGIASGFPGKITLLNLDDTPAGEISFGGDATEGGFSSLRGVTIVDDQLIGDSGRSTFNEEAGTSESTRQLALFNFHGDELHQFEEFSQVHSFRNPVFDEALSYSPFQTWAADPAGKVYTTPERNAYLIKAVDFEGNLLREMTREFTPRKRTQEDKDKITGGMRIIVNGRSQEIENRVLDHDPAIMGLNMVPDGRLFVVNCYQQHDRLTPGVLGRFDVLSPEGVFKEELTLALDGGNPEQDRLIFLDGQHFIVIFNFESSMDSMRAGFGQEEGEEEAVIEDVEPLEVGFYVLGK